MLRKTESPRTGQGNGGLETGKIQQPNYNVPGGDRKAPGRLEQVEVENESAQRKAPPPVPGTDLSEGHRIMLERSGIKPEVIRQRGYRTVKDCAELEKLGFEPMQARRVPALLIPLYGADGGLSVGHQIRPDNPRMRNGKPIKYERPKGSRNVLDAPPACLAKLQDRHVLLWITEGVKKADAVASAGACCIALPGGVWGWRGKDLNGNKGILADWEHIPLNAEREVLIAFDSDATEKIGVQQAEQRLARLLESRGARVRIARIPAAQDGGKQGLDDYLAAGGTLDELLAKAALPAPEPGHSSGQSGPKQSEVLLQLIRDAGSGFLVDSLDKAFVTFTDGGHHQTWPVRSGVFRRWALRLFYDHEGKPPGGQAIADAVGVLEALAHRDGQHVTEVPVRVGQDADALWLDLCEAKWRAVHITTEGWRVVDEPALHFRRVAGMLPLPVPLHPQPDPGGGKPHPLEELRKLVNTADADWPLVLGWLVGALAPAGPYPLLVLQGEQGSGKSTTARVLRELVDPNRSPVRSLPREEGDLLIAARGGWILAYDNLSGMPPWISDALCRMATGGGIGKRQLYTDADEVILDAKRPVILNGIDDIVRRNDLADRALVVNLPRIPQGEHRPERDFWREFEEARPRILGALLDAASTALRLTDSVPTKGLPRMADFARWVIAAEPALPWEPGTFLASYRENRRDIVEVALDGDQVVQALLGMLARHDGSWESTAGELLDELNPRVDEYERKSKAWPKSPRALSGRLRRAAPFLRASGIGVEFTQEAGGQRRRLVTFSKLPQSTVPTVPTVLPVPETAQGRDPRRSAIGTVEGRSGDDRCAIRPGRRPAVVADPPGRDGRDDSKPALTRCEEDDAYAEQLIGLNPEMLPADRSALRRRIRESGQRGLNSQI